MSLAKVPAFGFGGLNTRSNATGLPLLDLTVLQDMRVVGTDLVQRLGMVRVGQVTGQMSAMDFNAASSEVCAATIDTRVWALGLNWTVEFAIEPDTAAGTMGLVTAGHTTPAMIFDITGGNIRARVWDSAATLTTITVGAAATEVQTVQLTRNGATLSARLNNGTPVTGAMSATLNVRTPVGELRVARDDGANYFDGTACYLNVLSVTKDDHADRLIRMPNPRAEYVLACYDFNESAGGLVYDRSRYENHLVTANTPTEIAVLCHNPAPVRGLSMTADENNKKQLLVMAGGSYYIAAAG
jgi:hypothetical protein